MASAFRHRLRPTCFACSFAVFEIVGTIDELGDSAQQRLRNGDKVIVFVRKDIPGSDFTNYKPKYINYLNHSVYNRNAIEYCLKSYILITLVCKVLSLLISWQHLQ